LSILKTPCFVAEKNRDAAALPQTASPCSNFAECATDDFVSRPWGEAGRDGLSLLLGRRNVACPAGRRDIAADLSNLKKKFSRSS
jgi:hypothetical protein